MRLYVNIDHVATLREARRTDEPDPARAAAACEAGGADGITVHLREDRRHIQDADVRALQRTVRTVLNLELGANPEIVRSRAARVRSRPPWYPSGGTRSRPRAASMLKRGDRRIADALGRLKRAGIRVSLFIDPDLRVIDRAADLGVAAVELHTGRYAQTWRKSATALRELHRAAAHAAQRGLAVHAGHGLTYENVQPVAAIPEIEELNIGHSIVQQCAVLGAGRGGAANEAPGG